MVIIFAKIVALPEKRKELLQTIHSIIGQVKQENGCLQAGFYQDIDNENNLLVVEAWTNQTDSDNHVQSDIFTVLKGAESLMRQPLEIEIHTVSRSTGIEVRTPVTHDRV